MKPVASGDLKEQVRGFWNTASCDTQVARAEKFSRDYYDEIEAFRYFDQPYIHGFAQFSRYRRKRVLEVGTGAGTDFIQWLKAGALTSGIDLTTESLENVRHRIAAYDLPAPEALLVGDAEKLPFADETFDLGYSFGVLHHTPDTETALRELVRVIKPGGDLKVMLYNRHSIWVFNVWVKQALLRFRPWKSLRWVMWHYIESLGTKGYTRCELARLLATLPLQEIQIHTEMTSADYLAASAFPPLNWCWRALLRMVGTQQGWLPADYVQRSNDPDWKMAKKHRLRDIGRPMLTGNRLGFFHCISARKKS